MRYYFYQGNTVVKIEKSHVDCPKGIKVLFFTCTQCEHFASNYMMASDEIICSYNKEKEYEDRNQVTI